MKVRRGFQHKFEVDLFIENILRARFFQKLDFFIFLRVIRIQTEKYRVLIALIASVFVLKYKCIIHQILHMSLMFFLNLVLKNLLHYLHQSYVELV